MYNLILVIELSYAKLKLKKAFKVERESVSISACTVCVSVIK